MFINRNIVLGGVNPRKIKHLHCIYFVLILFVSSIFIISSDFVSAAPKKKASKKRAAVSGTSKKRAATGSASKKRAMSRTSSRKVVTKASSNNTVENKEEENAVVSCEAGNYLNGKKCAVCPKGYYCVGDNEKRPCPAGKYSPKVGGESELSCLSCEDYYWSDAGSSVCGKIKIRQWYSHWNDNNVMDRACSRSTYKWFDANTTVKCDNATFGDPAYGLGKGCGAPCGHITGEGQWYTINCKSLPCVISAGSDRQIRLTAEGKMECFGKSWGIEKEWSDCGNGKEVIKWK